MSLKKTFWLVLTMLSVNLVLFSQPQLPQKAPAKVIMKLDTLIVNKSTSIIIEKPYFPLMEEKSREFVTSEIDKLTSPQISEFIELCYKYEEISSQYYQHWSCEVVFQSQEIVSLLLRNNLYTGGAHPNTQIYNLNLNVKELKHLEKEKFYPKTDITKLASYCEKYLKDNSIPYFSEKSLADEKNFSIWSYTDAGTLFSFPQYEIAPYSSGIIQIFISNQELELLK
ncbi:MAG: hypothetical protein B6226_02560 [Candidatus Cloacimonetes bacterium 4572_65]|nr:MAG: hypothetical protein B6226_02560 [Candidatus Cloacimonetes bacterium 4572_65]